MDGEYTITIKRSQYINDKEIDKICREVAENLADGAPLPTNLIEEIGEAIFEAFFEKIWEANCKNTDYEYDMKRLSSQCLNYAEVWVIRNFHFLKKIDPTYICKS